MKKTAAVISFVVALVLGGQAISGWLQDAQAAQERFNHDTIVLSLARMTGDYRAADADTAEWREHERTLTLEATAGAAFLIAAVAMWPRKRQNPLPNVTIATG